ncbi:MAG TPA: M48 family metalloprotease [Nitrospinota bacterium]|nr:M48 family metalloprotease [Nitrospinota bacterium]|tara:strand:+ start:48877 stop:49908 length:1032 start_codon:yes stop_codon:yes gene_type:complete
MTSLQKSITSLLAVIFLTGTGTYAFDLLNNIDEESVGKEYDKEIVRTYGIYNNDAIAEYVTKIGNRVLSKVVAPEYKYHFKVLDHEMVNAFALPGGYIYVTRGLLCMINSEASLAGVLGHEIGHVIRHHAVKQMEEKVGQTLLALGGLAASEEVRENAAAWLTLTSSISQQINLGYGRLQENEADQIGMLLSYEAGYDPNGIVDFLKSLRTKEKIGGQSYHSFQATHPDTIARIIEAEGKSGLLKNRDAKGKGFRKRYLDAIDGIQYGRPTWRGKTLPPFTIKVIQVSKGDTFRTLSKKFSGDQGMALEIATLNGMNHNDTLMPGYSIKVLVPEKSSNRVLQK